MIFQLKEKVRFLVSEVFNFSLKTLTGFFCERFFMRQIN